MIGNVEEALISNNHIAIRLPPNNRWLPFLQDGVLRYARTVGFSQVLEDKIVYSVMEACEELIGVSEQAGVPEPYRVFLDFRGEAAIIEIEYSGRIPLNPFETEEYEIPEANTDLDAVHAEALWLFLIKKRMDRVFFRVRGTRRVLIMMQYRREEGRETHAWAMAVRPELRKGLHLHLQEAGDAPPHCVLQKAGGGALMLGPSETYFVRNMDGVKTFHDLYMAHVEAIGLVSPNLPSALYEKLEALDMLARGEETSWKAQWKAFLRRVVNPSISIPRADDVVTAVHRRTTFLFTPLGVILFVLLGLSGLLPLWEAAPLFLTKVAELERILFDAPQMLVPLYLLILVHVSLHELGHGVTCKHFGGNVSRMGILFYLAAFIFFCDTTAAHTFPERRQRLWVSLGGPIVSFAVFGLGLWGAWCFAGSNSLWEYVFIAFSLFNFFGLVMTFNPFIKMDAYYLLMDLTGIPNLREKSFRFLNRKLWGWLGFGADDDVKVTPRERRIFWWYGLLGAAMTFFFMAAPIAQLVRLLHTQSHLGGRALFLILVCTLLMARMGSLAFKRMRDLFYREYKLK